MDDPPQPPSIEHVVARLEEGSDAEARQELERFETATVDDRKHAIQSLRTIAEDRPAVLAPICPALTQFLEDDDRAVRLSTAKLIVALTASDPEAAVPIVGPLADRLADAEEFYYVRARAAEALGYVALDHPDEVASPDLLADLRIGLSFDEPEVKAKLAKALEYVALGDPERLRHQVSTLADHLDDDDVLVRYHLTTTLVAVGTASPDRLTPVADALVCRLDDENDYVRGRAAEALGLLVRANADEATRSELAQRTPGSEEASFVSDRLQFITTGRDGTGGSDDVPAEVGTLEGIRATTTAAVEAITAPDGDAECPHCGLVLPEDAPPTCPRCGAPY